MLAHMWGDEESFPVTDMECDYGGDDDDKMSDTSLHHMFDNDEYDWREALRVVGLSDEYIQVQRRFSSAHHARGRHRTVVARH